MQVGSVLEVYTTMFGWSLYGTLFEVLSITGFLYYPLFMALYRNWKEPVMSQDDKSASIISQRRMTYDVVVILLVFSFAIVPFTNLTVSDIKFRVACTDASGAQDVRRDVDGDDTGTTFDHVFDDNFDDNTIVRIPMLWALVLNVSSGMNAAVISSFRCFEDIKGFDKQLRNLTIKDPALRQEYSRFYNECFVPAKGRLDNALQGGDHQVFVETQLEEFFSPTGPLRHVDKTDPFFIGSRFYLATPGFYNSVGVNRATCNAQPGGCPLRARSSVKGWAFDADRDTDFSPADITKGVAGKPFCDEWWNTPTRGLQSKLLNSIEANKIEIFGWDDLPGNTLQKSVAFLTNAGTNLRAQYHDVILNNPHVLEDLIVQRFSDANPPSFTGGSNHFSSRDATTTQMREIIGASAGAAAYVARMMAAGKALPALTAGASVTAITVADSLKDFYVTMYIVQNAAPMIQAVLLMMIYGLMIFYFVISEYDIDSIITMILLILTVRFFTSLWVFADYLDARLYTAMFPDITHLGSVLTQGINRYLLDMVLTIMYIAVPALFLFLVTLAGQRISGMGSSSSEMSGKLSNIKIGSIGKMGK